MSIIRDALEYLISLGRANETTVPPEDTEYRFFDKPQYRPDPPRPAPLATTRTVGTLRSLAAYLAENIDGLDLAQHLLHVVGPGEVQLISRLEDFHRRRETVVSATYDSGVGALLGRWIDLETAMIGLMSLFTSEGDRDKLLDTLKSVKREKAEIAEDDGMNQRVVVQAGVASLATARIVNPVRLYPFCSFPEAPQTERLFVVRLQDAGGVQVLLKPADGEAWRVEATRRVADALADYLRGSGLGDTPAIIY